MRSLRIAAPIALGMAALIGVAVTPSLISAGSSAEAQPAVSHEVPVAHTAGDDLGPPIYPSIVNVRLVRAEAALARATDAVDEGQEAQAVAEIISARTNMVKAWTATRYVIAHTPAPDPEAEEEPPPTVIAAPADTAAAVLDLQHDVVTTSLGLLDIAGPALAPTLRGTISGTMSARDAAINYIHTVAPPPVAEEGRVHAKASGAPVIGGTFDIVMPAVIPFLDDEIQMASGTAPGAATAPNFGAWVSLKVTATENLINTFWPPVPVED